MNNMQEFEIKLNEEPNKGAFIASDAEGNKAGEMTFSKAGADKIIVDHTEVEKAYSGKGVGKLLFEAVIQYAKEMHMKIMPLCPFAASMFKKNPQYHEMLFGA
jgi:predicted GNAT family acetyltransferase